MNTQRKTRLGNACLTGLTAGALITLIWFLWSQSMRKTGIAIFLTGVIVFLLAAGIQFLCRKTGQICRRVVNVLLILFSVLALFSATTYALAPSFLFYPHFDEEAYKELAGYHDAEEVSFETADGIISGWILHNTEEPAPLVLYFGGNGENASTHILSHLNGSIDHSAFAGYNFAFFDYPGYGKSTGASSEASIKEYSLAVYDYVASRNDVEQIVVMGYSLGTGAANYVASQRDVNGLILMAPYADGYDLYNGMVPAFYGPLRLLVAYKMESVKFAENIMVRPLLLASPTDEFVSYDSSLRLSAAYPNGCHFFTIEGIGHNDFLDNPEVFDEIEHYLGEVTLYENE